MPEQELAGNNPKRVAGESPSVPVATTIPLPAESVAFLDWARRYQAAKPEWQPSLLTEGTHLANEHRNWMRRAIVENPQAALAAAVPVVVRQALPKAITALLEERVNAKGHFGVLGLARDGTLEPAIRRIAKIGPKRYEAYVFGSRSRQRTTEGAHLVGVAVDNLLALDEAPLRQLEIGERPDPALEVVESCPISGKTTAVQREADAPLPPISEETPAVESAGKIYFLCHGGHIKAFSDGLLAQEGGTGGPSKPTGTIPSSWTTGPRRVLYIRLTFPDKLDDPQSERDAYEMMRQVNEFIYENSYGKCYFLTTVTPLLVLPKTEGWYDFEDTDNVADAVLSDGRAVAREAGFDTSAYDLYAVRYNGSPGSFSGQGYVGSSGVWLKSSSAGVAVHEFGHNFGLWHANYWNTSGVSAIGHGSNSEYGNDFDTMGAASAGNNHFCSEHRRQLSWLPAGSFNEVRQSGIYRVFQMDQPILDPAKRYALMVAKDHDREYWAEHRRRFTSNAWMMNGVQLLWSPWGDSTSVNTTAGSNGGAQLLDTTPGSPDAKSDSPVVLGRTFSDAGSGIHFTPLSKNGTNPESIDVAVNLGQFPTNQAPTLSLSASALSVAQNSNIILTATATDPDGDTLAYYWDFGDKTVGANSSVVTKLWSAAGHYPVRCEVSDMKGGKIAKHLLVTVGAPSTLIATGVVRDSANQPLEGVRIFSSSTRATYTDSDGAYTLTGLSSGYSLNAALYGYTFVPAGNNFTGTALPTVNLTAVDDTASETAGNEATLRFTRTGDTSSAMTVRTMISGTATFQTDYSLSPAATSNLTQFTFTIPAGQATLDVTVTASNDTSAEGPEIARFALMPTTAYLTNGPVDANVTIVDNDTSLPLVSLVPLDLTANETGDSASFLLRRTGATTAALNVALTLSGTATNGSDFPSLTSPQTIPAGQAEITITLSPTDDTVVEGLETLTVALASSAAYLRASNAQAATFHIADSDIPVLTVTATDASASETPGDPGVFTITRTGDPTAALQVEYALGGTAHHGTDYAPLLGTATIPAGQASATVNVFPVDDSIGEPAQTAVLTLRSEPRYLVGTPHTATVTIADNDLSYVAIDSTSGPVVEGGLATFRILTTGTGSGNITVAYAVSGTATSGVDFTPPSGTISVARANGTATLSIPTLGDTDLEDAESITITLLPDPAPTATYTLHPESSATQWINEDDQVFVSISTTAATNVPEGTALEFLLSRSNTTAALTVNVALSGTATAGADYTDPGTTVNFPAATAYVKLVVTTLTDSAVEGTETVTATLMPGAYGSKIATATGYINDAQINSFSRSVRFSAATSSAIESGGTINIPVTLSSSSSSLVTVHYSVSGGTATGGVDYSLTNGILTFLPGETAQNIQVILTDDLFPESGETILLVLTNPYGARLGTASHTLTITDNDTGPAPLVAFQSASSSGSESITTPTSLVVNLLPAQAGPVTVPYAVTGGTATPGDDFTLASGTLTFAANETSKTIPLTVVDDVLNESAETVIVTLGTPAGADLGAPAVHTYTILDNDQVIVSVTAGDDAASEDGDSGHFLISRAGSNLGSNVTVTFTLSGTAVNGTDYGAVPLSVTIPAGAPTAQVFVTPVDDNLIEGTETVTLTLDQGTGGSGGYQVLPPLSATLIIQDNENTPPVIAITSPVGGVARLPSANVGLMITAQITDDGRPNFPNGTITAAWSQVSGPNAAIFESPTQASTAVRFPVAGNYVLRLTASDSAVAATSDVMVEVGPVSLTGTDIGNASLRPGSFSQTGGIYTVTGSGSGLASGLTADDFYFLSRPMSGNVEIIARLASLSGSSGTSSRCGLMIRESTAQGAQYGMMALTTNRLMFGYRKGVDAASQQSTTNTNPAAPRWLRLVKTGSTITAYHGTNGTTWTQQGSPQTYTNFSPNFLIGFSVTSANTSTSVTATFESLRINHGNLAPHVHAGPDATINVGSTHTLSGTFSDDGLPAPPSFEWTKISGSSVLIPDPASLTNTLTFTESGNYRFRLVADDTQAATFDDVDVTVTAPPQVSVTAQGNPSEFGAVTGKFLLSTPVALASALPVAYSLTGTAASGMDFNLLGSATIPAGQTITELTLQPLPDSLSEGPETVTLQILPNSVYTVALPDSATLTLMDLPIDAWRSAEFGIEANNPTLAADSADPEKDGLDNLHEYAFGSAPLIPSPHWPTAQPAAAALRYHFLQNPNATDVTFTPQWSETLSDWHATGITLQQLGHVGPLRLMQATYPLPSGNTRTFLKLRIERVSP